jgi:hypothetical protein
MRFSYVPAIAIGTNELLIVFFFSEDSFCLTIYLVRDVATHQ